MRKLFLFLGITFAIFGIIFAILPMGSLGLLPIGISIIFIILAFLKSNFEEKKIVKIIFIIAWLTLLVIVFKNMIPDKIAKDVQFEKRKEDSKKEDLKELENLEKDLE